MTDKPAARVGDQVAHTSALSGALMRLAAGALIGAAIIATGGLGAIAIGGALAVTGGLGIGGQYIGQSMMGPPTGMITIGSNNVYINNRLAACAVLSFSSCAKEYGLPQPVATGAATVLINGMPVARKDEKIMCSATIIDGSNNVFIGGHSEQKIPMNPEVPVWLSTTMQAMMWGGIIVSTGGIAASYGSFAAVGTLIGGFGGGWLGSIAGRFFADTIGYGETGQRVGEVFGGLLGSFAGSYGGFRGGQAMGNRFIPKPMTPMEGFLRDGIPGRQAVINQQSPRYGATGKSSGRTFNPEKAGGPIENMDYSTAKITSEGIEEVQTHLARFEAYEPNRLMLERLDRISNGEIAPTEYDLRFYTHELRELQRYRNLGIPDDVDAPYEVWNNTHTATLEDYGISELDSNKNRTLYHPDTWEFY